VRADVDADVRVPRRPVQDAGDHLVHEASVRWCTHHRHPPAHPVAALAVPSDLDLVAMLAAIFDLSHHTTVFKSGWFEITLANLIVFVLLVVVFVAALFVQLPGRARRDAG
jgi:hypothetical protein